MVRKSTQGSCGIAEALSCPVYHHENTKSLVALEKMEPKVRGT